MRDKQLNMRVPTDFPFTTRELWDFLIEIDRMFIELNNGTLEEYFKYNPRMQILFDKYHQWREGVE